jgi:hypothetical protein
MQHLRKQFDAARQHISPKLRPGADVVAFQKREIARRYRREPNYASFRLPELIRLFGHLWGSELPDDRKGRFALYIAFQTLRECRSLPDQVMTEFADQWAQWMDEDELMKLKDRVFDKPRRFKPDTLARRFGVTIALRDQLRLTTIGAIDCNRTQRLERRKVKRAKNSTARRRKAGAISREEYELGSAASTKPWEALGICKRTYYYWLKLGKIARPSEVNCTSPRPAPLLRYGGPRSSAKSKKHGSKAGMASAGAAATRPAFSRSRRSQPKLAKTG